MNEEIKICKSCIHIKNKNDNYYELACCSLSLRDPETIDLVSGEVKEANYHFCSIVRHETKMTGLEVHCGPTGLNWQQAETVL